MPHPFEHQINAAHASARQALGAAQATQGKYALLEQEFIRLAREQQALAAALSRVNVQAQMGDPNIQRIENIPGRRIPFDFIVDIPINFGVTAPQPGLIPIDQTGPFVAVARRATFMSTYQFQLAATEEDPAALFNGRSYGRYRPIHSANDVNDGQPFSSVSMAQAFPGTGAPHIASPSNQSPFRSMEMDFRIFMREQGSSLPRQNIPIPSSMWVESLGDAFQLGSLDFFERNQVIQIEVAPNHVANPAYGNVSGFTGPGGVWPFIDSQWDAVEGISDPAIVTGDDTDPITRLPSGVLTIGYTGFRIIQPPGPGQF